MNWITKPLGDAVVQMKTGSTPSTSHSEYFEGDIPWFTPGDIGNSRNLIKSSRTITQEALSTGKAKIFDKNMLLVTCIGNIGRVGVLQQKSSSNQQITALKFPKEIDPYFAYYWFLFNQYKLENLANQAVVPILNNKRLSEVSFSYPPLPEQKEIAAQLAQADRLRQLRRNASQLGESYLQSAFLEMFGDPETNPMGWDEVALGEICHKFQNGTGKGKDFYGSGHKVANIGDLYGWHTFVPVKYSLLQVSEKEVDRYKLKRGDLLFVRSSLKREGVAYCSAYISEEVCLFSSFMIRVRPNPDFVKSNFLSFLLRLPSMRKRLISASNTAVITNISQDNLKTVCLPLPPLAEQERFAQIVARYEHLRAQMRESTRQAELLFQGLLWESFG